MHRARLALRLVWLATTCACGSDKLPATAEKSLGTEGGVIEVEGLRLEIPPGALTTAVEVRVSTLPRDAVPFETLGPVYRFEPEGLQLATPAVLRLDVPEGTSADVMWSTPDGEGFEVVGYSLGGAAYASTTHFSQATVVTPDCNFECDEHDEHDVPIPAEECDSAPPLGLVYLRWCGCHELETGESMCATNTGAYGQSCPDRDPTQFPDANGRRMYGHRNGDPCKGYLFAGVEVHLCGCYAEPRPGSVDRRLLCPTRHTLDENGELVCRTTLHPGDLEFEGYGGATWPPPGSATTEPKYGDPLYDSGTGYFSYMQEGHSGSPATCRGWVHPDERDPTNPQEGAMPIEGTIDSCDTKAIDVDYRWSEFNGVSGECDFFTLDADAPVPENDSPARRNLSVEEWVDVEGQRLDCNVPPNVKGAHHTVAVLYAEDTPPHRFFGLSQVAKGLYQDKKANPKCPEEPKDVPLYNFFCRVSLIHAEGRALAQLAHARGRVIAPDGTVRDKEGAPKSGGCAEIISDRQLCKDCQKPGMEVGRRIAGLQFLIVRDGAGCRCYGDGPGEEVAFTQPNALGWEGGICRNEDVKCASWKGPESLDALCRPIPR